MARASLRKAQSAQPFMGAQAVALRDPALHLILKMETQRYKWTSIQHHTAQTFHGAWSPHSFCSAPLESNQGECLSSASQRAASLESPTVSVNPWVLQGRRKKKKGSERNHFNIGSWELYGFEKRRNKRIGYKWGERGCNRKFGKNEGPQILRSRPTVEYGCSPSLYLTFLEHHITSVHITGPIQLSYWGPILPYWWEFSSQSFLGFLTLPFPGPTSEPRGGVVGVPSGCQTTEMVLGIPLSPTIPPVAGSETCDCFSRKLGTQGSSPLMPLCSSEPIFSGILNPGILAPWHFCLQVSPSSLSTLPSLPLLSRR